MKWLAFVLLLIQADCFSSCIFDKVEKFRGASIRSFVSDLDKCFAGCYENKNCTTAWLDTKQNVCSLYGVGDYQVECDNGRVCYVLQRDEADSACKKYVNF